jgi:uncharacterized phiE125 gp8 family phage protein
VISDADLLAYVLPATDADLPTLRRLEKAAVAHVQQVTGRYYGAENEITETIPRYGPVIHLADTPLNDSLVLESWDGSAWVTVETDDFTLTDKTVEFVSPSGWNRITGPSRYRATYDAGYAVADDPEATEAPEDVKQAVLMLVTHWYENREAVVVGTSNDALSMAVTSLLSPHTRVAV